jgi:hypothetical protein
VREPLVWLREADPASTIEAARRGDPKLQAKAALFAAMADFFGVDEDRARTAAQIIEASDISLGTVMADEAKRQALRAALMVIVPAGTKDVSPQRRHPWDASLRGPRPTEHGDMVDRAMQTVAFAQYRKLRFALKRREGMASSLKFAAALGPFLKFQMQDMQEMHDMFPPPIRASPSPL